MGNEQDNRGAMREKDAHEIVILLMIFVPKYLTQSHFFADSGAKVLLISYLRFLFTLSQ